MADILRGNTRISKLVREIEATSGRTGGSLKERIEYDEESIEKLLDRSDIKGKTYGEINDESNVDQSNIMSSFKVWAF